MDTPPKEYKALYKSWRGQKPRPAQLTQAMNNPQEIRHPTEILKVTAPTGHQFLMSLQNAKFKVVGSKLRDKVALCRAVKSGDALHGTENLEITCLLSGDDHIV